jgi:integrase
VIIYFKLTQSFVTIVDDSDPSCLRYVFYDEDETIPLLMASVGDGNLDDADPAPVYGGTMARRRYQRGSITLIGKRIKVWLARWREDELQPDGTIQRRRRAEVLGTLQDYPTKRLALRELETKVADVNSVDYKPSPNIHFREFAAKWQDTVLVNHELSTQSSATSVIKTHLVPAFGAIPLKDISAEMLQTWVSRSKRKPKTIRNVVAMLRMMWNTAKAWKYVRHDPFDGLVYPKAEIPEEQAFFTEEEMRLLLGVSAEPLRSMFWMAAETGMRVGELCAVRWEDLDLATGKLTIAQSVWCGHFKLPKNNRKRACIISRALADHLQTLSRQPEQKQIFVTSACTHFDQGNVRATLYAMCEKVKIPRRGMHAFRHGNGTIMAQLAAAPKLRLQRLGHSDERLMLRYEHVITQDEIALAQKLGHLVSGQA